MDKLYMVILLLTIIPILICIKYARKVKSDVADSITRCLFFVTITIISNIVFAFSQYQLVAYFMESVYLFFFDLVLIYILQYSQQYTNIQGYFMKCPHFESDALLLRIWMGFLCS